MITYPSKRIKFLTLKTWLENNLLKAPTGKKERGKNSKKSPAFRVTVVMNRVAVLLLNKEELRRTSRTIRSSHLINNSLLTDKQASLLS